MHVTNKSTHSIVRVRNYNFKAPKFIRWFVSYLVKTSLSGLTRLFHCTRQQLPPLHEHAFFWLLVGRETDRAVVSDGDAVQTRSAAAAAAVTEAAAAASILIQARVESSSSSSCDAFIN